VIDKRREWPIMIALTVVLVIPLAAWGLWRSAVHRSSNPLSPGVEAFARGDWKTAADVARKRLKDVPDDIPALQLLARSSVKLGLDSSALSLYQRLGPDLMTADDSHLLGIALRRTGNPRGIEVWEEALGKTPDHAEILDALSRVYFESARYGDAASLARRLVQHPEWRLRASRLLGKIEFARNKFINAIHYWRQAIDQESVQDGTSNSARAGTRKDLARALLHAGQPAEARGQLQLILAKAPDAEASWLLSRAYLQECAVPEALVALKEAGSFADEDPTRPDPAPYSGSASCLPCHGDKYQSQQRSRHAKTFHRVSELQDLDLPRARVADPIDPSVTHTFQKTDDRLVQETRTPEHLFRAIVDYAFGSGDRGKTLVGHDPTGQALELRLSIYREKTAQAAWDVTGGHDPHPPTDQGFLGQPMTEVAVDRCLSCHVTNPQAILAASGLEAADHAIGCEKCHGPGGNHLLAVAARFPDLAIARPSLASGSRMVKICAQCHSPQGSTVEPDDPTSVRFQGTTLTWSRCFTESHDALDCVTCHDPHRNVETSRAHYEAKCLTCHGGQPTRGAPASAPRRHRLDEARERTTCPVNPSSGCIDCHMPAVTGVIPYSFFTDHNIRVHRQ
jgi:tetratricopeptide (TPR) repeat protein